MYTKRLKNSDVVYTYFTEEDYNACIEDLKDMDPKVSTIIQYFYGWMLAGIDAVEPAGRFLDFLTMTYEPGTHTRDLTGRA